MRVSDLVLRIKQTTETSEKQRKKERRGNQAQKFVLTTQKMRGTHCNLYNPSFIITHPTTQDILKGQSWFFILFKRGSVDKIESPDESEDAEQDPTEKVVAEAEG